MPAAAMIQKKTRTSNRRFSGKGAFAYSGRALLLFIFEGKSLFYFGFHDKINIDRNE